MATCLPQLALGTAQFGLAYGITGNAKPVADREVRSILAIAWESGVRVLDTAPAYGDIEGRLQQCSAGSRFRIVSKIPALPVDADISPRKFISASVRESQQRLGDHLDTLLFHNAQDLLSPAGDDIWDAAESACQGYGIRIGVSCYSPAEAEMIQARFPIEVCQLPGNALDQRLVSSALVAEKVKPEIHLRSILLQGLLLMSQSRAEELLPASAPAMRRWISWCQEHEKKPLVAALSAAISLPGVRFCVLGVDSVEQFEELATSWDVASLVDVADVACEDLQIIDPRRWNR